MIRRLLLVASLLPWTTGLAQQARSAAPAAPPLQDAEWTIPDRRLDFYAGLRSNGDTDFMTGVKYSRRLPSARRFAGAGFLEVTFSDPTLYILGGLLQFMPLHRLLLETGPGVALNGGSEFLWRVGAEYELQIDRLLLIPKVYLDFVDGTSVVGYGIAIGRR